MSGPPAGALLLRRLSSLPRQGAQRLRRLPESIIVDRVSQAPTVLLTSTARAGSTWLAELLTQSRGTRYIFEPYYPARVEAFAAWAPVPYFAPGHTRTGAQARVAAEVLAGRMRSPWSDQMNRTVLVRRRVIKEVRSNIMAAWLQSVREDLKVVLLVRHPVDVAASRLALGWDHKIEMLLGQPALVADHLGSDGLAQIRSLRTAFGVQVARWAIENVVALRDLRPGKALVVAYEDLAARPAEELARLEAHLPQFPIGAAARDVARPSRTAGLRTRPLDAPSRQELAEAHRILSHFGLDELYDGRTPPGFADRPLLEQFRTPGGS